MARTRLFTTLLTAILGCCISKVSAQDEIIEHEGNKYIINVEKLNPDSEMTLMDVLHMCPELISDDGHKLTADYVLSVDDIMLSVDFEPMLEGIKACDLHQVIVCTYGAVNNAMDGTSGSIDLQFKEESKDLYGKLALNGSTYGNGKAYADITSKSENFTLRAFAQTNLQYGKANTSETEITSRNGIENAMVFMDWQLTEKDLLKFKLSQGYGEQNDRLHNNGSTDDMLSRQRWGELVATYERTLNEQEAGLYFEAGMNYTNSTLGDVKERNAWPWWIAECSIPFFNQTLWMTAGYEGGYSNVWYQDINREQYLNNDLYVQFDYKKGPWIITLGDRFRNNTFWNKPYEKEGESLWSYNRSDHAFFASAGYKKGHHFVQGIFNRSYFNPSVNIFINYLEEGPTRYNTDQKTRLAWRSELRYTYQAEQIVAICSATHTLLTDMPLADESLIGLGTTVTWNKGPLRITGGVNAYHHHYELLESVYDNYFTLKCAPTLLLGKGFRLSSVLLFNSKRKMSENHAHLYASIKVNKDLGRRCNVFADFHDIAGQPDASTLYMMQSYKNRALTLGLTYYPFR
jgi:hypothetical protein